MPNRILRDWTDSFKINDLDANTERFFVRLMMKVDDYGCYSADLRLIRASLYPLLLDKVREADIARWMDECQKANIVRLYEIEGKKYVQILEFGQRLDRAKSKYPQPITNEPLETANGFPPEKKRKETNQKGENDLLVSNYDFSKCELKADHPHRHLIESGLRLFSFFRQNTQNKDLEIYSLREWLEPIKILLKNYKREQIEELVEYANADKFWGAIVLNTDSLQRNFEKIKAQLIKSANEKQG